jgi:hypothetical protein
MKGHHKYGSDKKHHNNGNARRGIHEDEWLTDETLYKWRKRTAIEIQFLTRNRKEFYDLYLRNVN